MTARPPTVDKPVNNRPILESDLAGDWRRHAACRGHDPDMWELRAGPVSAAYETAHRICNTCPVRRECLALAIRTKSRGVIMGGRDFIQDHPTSARARQYNTPADA